MDWVKQSGIVNIDYEDEAHGYGIEEDKGDDCAACEVMGFVGVPATYALMDKGGGGPSFYLCERHLEEFREKGPSILGEDLLEEVEDISGPEYDTKKKGSMGKKAERSLYSVTFSYSFVVEANDEDEAEVEGRKRWDEIAPRTDEMNVDVDYNGPMPPPEKEYSPGEGK